MARLFILGEKSSQIINLDYVSLIEIEHCQGKNHCKGEEEDYSYYTYYRITFYLTHPANLDTDAIFHDYTFKTERDARNYLVGALNLEF